MSVATFLPHRCSETLHAKCGIGYIWRDVSTDRSEFSSSLFALCGRFTLRTPAAAWIPQFLPLWNESEIAARISEITLAARYNIAPTQAVPCVIATDDGKRDLQLREWGLVPFWAKDRAIGSRMINARSETAAEKRSFAKPFRERRCVVPADGYFEWMNTTDRKQPYYIRRSDGGMLAMAGLWESNQKLADDSGPLETFTVLTTAANKSTSDIHDRMPVFLDSEDQTCWLDHDSSDTDRLRALLKPAPDDWLVCEPVSKLVNSPRNDRVECIEPIGNFDSGPKQRPLF